jgi:hypothetical protein
VRHCERNEVVAFSREEQREVAGGNPESFHFAESLLPHLDSWVAASRVALLAMTNAALTLTPFVVILSNHERIHTTSI